MKARYHGTCTVCNKQWYKDADIARWLGDLVHQACKDREVSRVRSQAHVEVLPTYLDAIDTWESRREVTRKRAHNRYGPRATRRVM